MVFPLIGIANAGFAVMASAQAEIEAEVAPQVVASVAIYQKTE
jgi:hypothetical protein